jgi:hypothetical protein
LSNNDRDHLIATRQWLFRQCDSLDDACVDATYAAKGGTTYLAVDFSFLYPNVIATYPLRVDNIRHWLNLSSVYVYDHIHEYKTPETIGYKLVLTGLAFICLARHFIDDYYILDGLLQCTDESEIYDRLKIQLGLSPDANHTPDTGAALATAIDEISNNTTVRNHKLQRLVTLLRDGVIIGEGDILDKDLLRRAFANKDDFNNVRSVIDTFRNDAVRSNPDEDRFFRSIEALSIVSCKNISDYFDRGRYVFLGWPKCRAFYGSDARKYHRIITSPFYRMVTLKETPYEDDLVRSANANLMDRRDELQFFHHKVVTLERDRHASLPPLMLRGITLLRNDYVKHLRGDTSMMEADERKRLAQSLCGKQHQVRDAIAQAVETASDSVKTLSDLAAEFRLDNLIAGYEFLRDDEKVRKIFRTIKPGP